MTHALYGDDPEPEEQGPAARLCVPARPVAHGFTIRLFLTPVGDRTAAAFTSPERLRAVLGAEHPWIPLSEPALRALVRPLGIRTLTFDPALSAPTPSAAATPPPAPTSTPAPAPGRPLSALTR